MDRPPPPTRLGGALLAYLSGVVLLLTLAPFRFGVPEHFDVLLSGPWSDVAANVVLFLPLGFVYRLGRPERTRGALHALGFGLLLSGFIECTQLFEPERYTSLVDVATNALGAALGSALHDAAQRRLRLGERRAGRLALELPLLGAVYLLLPLLWLVALPGDVGAGVLTRAALLGLFGAVLLGAVQHHYLGPAGVLSSGGVRLAAALWFLVGGFPLLLARPLPVLALAVGVAAVAGWGARRPGAERRFEVPALRAALPFYTLYLALLALLPLRHAADAWQLSLAFPPSHDGLALPGMMELLEVVAAFTLLGYLVAELGGRSEQPFQEAARRVGVLAAGAALGLEVARGWAAGESASALRFLLLVAAALQGGWIYHLQRAHVRQRAREEAAGASAQEAALFPEGKSAA
jgi:hypothetical protein